MNRLTPRSPRRLGVALVASGIILGTAGVATADRIAPISFEPPTYTTGNIHNQQGWQKTGPYDAAVAAVASFPAAAEYRFGVQALRISNAFAQGSFGDQTFSPGLLTPASETGPNRHFEASFRIGSTQATHQPNLRVTVSPDDGQGARMSFLRFEDQPDGIHVIFFDVKNAGPVGTVSDFVDADIATMSRRRAHRVAFVIDLKPGHSNDVVRIYIDGKLKRVHGRKAPRACSNAHHSHPRGERCDDRGTRNATGTSWENYYRYDPEQTPTGNQVPVVRKLLFRLSGTPAPLTASQGFLFDKVSLLSSNVPKRKRDCKLDGWMTLTRADGSPFTSRSQCVRYAKRHSRR